MVINMNPQLCKKVTLSLVLFALGFLATPFAAFAATLEASVDRSKIYENDTLTLRLVGSVEINSGLGGLMNFGLSQFEAPTIESLENDFEILDRQQSYSMRSVNGDAQAELTWNYTLLPKRTGTLTIPAAVFKTAQSNAIDISVLKGKAPRDASAPPKVFLEVNIDKHTAYVQEQLMFTVSLYSQGRIANASLSEPSSNDAIIERFGEERKFYRMAHNQRYEVIERNYLIFPQKSGELKIDSLDFNGMLVDRNNRRNERIRERSESLTLDILPPNENFSGSHWLPAKSLYLSEEWDTDAQEIQVGDAITRTISITALGLLGSALPPTEANESPHIKSYPDKAQVSSAPHDSGSQAGRIESTTFIAISEGTLTLPEVKIPWWDTLNNVERVATLPARTINIRPSPETARAPSTLASTDQTIEQSEASTSTEVGQPAVSESNESNRYSHGLLALITLLILGWCLSTWYLLQKLAKTRRELAQFARLPVTKPSINEISLAELLNAVNSASVETPKLVISWLNAQAFAKRQERPGHRTHTYQSIAELEKDFPKLYEQLSSFEQNLYGKDPSANYSSESLCSTLKLIAKQAKNKAEEKKPALRPFYP